MLNKCWPHEVDVKLGKDTMLTNLSLMTLALASQFHVFLPWVNACLAWCLKSVLNVKAVVGSFNQEKDLEGAFSVIVKSWRNLREPSFEALHLTRTPHCRSAWEPGPSWAMCGCRTTSRSPPASSTTPWPCWWRASADTSPSPSTSRTTWSSQRVYRR